MGRYDAPRDMTSGGGLTLQRVRDRPTAHVMIRRHNRAFLDPPPGAEWLQPIGTGPQSHRQPIASDVTPRSFAGNAFDAIRLTPSAGADVATVVRSLRASPDLPPALGTPISVFRMGDETREPATPPRGGTQAVARAIDILDAIAERPMMLAELAERVGLAPPTCYRIAKAMAARGLLSASGRNGFALGPKAGKLGLAYKRQSKSVSTG